MVTAFPADGDYIDTNILTPENDIVYDRATDKQYEAPAHVASGVMPSGLAAGASSNNTIARPTKESNTPIQKSERENSDWQEGNTAKMQLRDNGTSSLPANWTEQNARHNQGKPNPFFAEDFQNGAESTQGRRGVKHPGECAKRRRGRFKQPRNKRQRKSPRGRGNRRESGGRTSSGGWGAFCTL